MKNLNVRLILVLLCASLVSKPDVAQPFAPVSAPPCDSNPLRIDPHFTEQALAGRLTAHFARFVGHPSLLAWSQIAQLRSIFMKGLSFQIDTSSAYDKTDAPPIQYVPGSAPLSAREATLLAERFMTRCIELELDIDRLIAFLPRLDRMHRQIDFYQRQEVDVPSFLYQTYSFITLIRPKNVVFHIEAIKPLISGDQWEILVLYMLGHEIGHIAERNDLMVLKPGKLKPTIPSSVRRLFPEKVIIGRSQDILACVFNDAVLGNTFASIGFLAVVTFPTVMKDVSVYHALAGDRAVAELLTPNQFTREALAISDAKQREIRDRHPEWDAQTLEDLAHYYHDVAVSYQVADGVIRRPGRLLRLIHLISRSNRSPHLLGAA